MKMLTVRIYDTEGDLVEEFRHPQDPPNFSWDAINKKLVNHRLHEYDHPATIVEYNGVFLDIIGCKID